MTKMVEKMAESNFKLQSVQFPTLKWIWPQNASMQIGLMSPTQHRLKEIQIWQYPIIEWVPNIGIPSSQFGVDKTPNGESSLMHVPCSVAEIPPRC